MILARGPCCWILVSLLLSIVCSVLARGEPVSPMSLLIRARLLWTYLLPLPEAVVVLVESLPRRDVVLAVKTREVGHAVCIACQQLSL